MKTIAFVVAHDSQLKWAQAVRQALPPAEWRTEVIAIAEYAGFSTRQCADAGFAPEHVRQLCAQAALDRFLALDVVVFLLVGGQTEQLIYALRERLRRLQPATRPVIAAAYVGVVIDGHVGGLLFRAPADLVFVNSQSDLELFHTACAALDIPADGLVLSGLAILAGQGARRTGGAIRQTLFADQIIIPKSVPERRYIYSHMLRYAEAHPEVRVIIKPRHRPGEASIHKTRYAPESFFNTAHRPPNLVVDYTPLPELLPETDLLLTVSSTAALEALTHGVNVAIIADAGIKEGYGNHIFLQSGLIRSFARIMEHDIGSVHPAWLAQYAAMPPDGLARICRAIEDACARNAHGGLPLPEAPYFTAREAFYREAHHGAPASVAPKPGLLMRIGTLLLPPIIARPLHTLLRKAGLL